MRPEDELDDLDVDTAMEAVERTLGKSFSDAVKALGLDHRHNFRCSDLRGVDFTDSDIRGFDFTEAMLDGCFGINVTWDKTTILDGAAASNSIFALDRRLSSVFDDNRRASSVLKLMSGSTDADQISWLASNLKAGAKYNDIARHVAEALFLRANKAFLKAELLNYVIGPFQSDAEIIDTALGLLADPNVEGLVVRAAFDTLRRRRLYSKDFIRATATAMLASENLAHRVAAMRFIVQTGLEDKEREAVIRAARADDGKLFRHYVEVVAEKLGEVHDLVVHDPRTNEIMDPIHPIAAETLQLIARRWLRAEKSEGKDAHTPLRSRKLAFLQFPDQVVAHQANKVGEILRSLTEFGINYTLSPSLNTALQKAV
ncbi:hypothetical protein [Rhizobium rhizogenes]|uniref:hypothetical protein n=1 Tax=Rhizobium rhizogenes TaxID=359 RepID=UPI0022B61B83|nr:hypothetical protein [Rhizobium rhizogenes]MCZ7448140.1 hypothetical protein [Rhizobium rhizogenes]MCZ7465801.1 hypothetical protein [Rhizobium rhizogenes]